MATTTPSLPILTGSTASPSTMVRGPATLDELDRALAMPFVRVGQGLCGAYRTGRRTGSPHRPGATATHSVATVGEGTPNARGQATAALGVRERDSGTQSAMVAVLVTLAALGRGVGSAERLGEGNGSALSEFR